MTLKLDEFRSNLAELYLQTPDVSDIPFVKERLEEIADINLGLFGKIPYSVTFTEEDPYPDFGSVRSGIRKSKILKVFTGGAECPYVRKRDQLIGRAVHDVYGHLYGDFDFTFKGELMSYAEQRDLYPVDCWPILFSEICMQSAYYHTFGAYPVQKIVITGHQTYIGTVAMLTYPDDHPT